MQSDDLSRMVMGDHRELLAAARSVEAMVDSESRATGDVARRIEELATLLGDHIVAEEASALYREYPQRHAAVRDELERLQAAHAPLVGELNDLARACEAAAELDLDSPLSIRIRAAIASLRVHEAAEADVLQKIRDGQA